MIIEDENGREWTTDELRDWDREPTEPDPEPPLTLEEIAAAYDAYVAGGAGAEGKAAAALLLEEAVPQMMAKLGGYHEAEEVWAELPTRTEWTVTASADEPPGTEALWQISPEDAEQVHGRPGQLWCRTLTIGAPVAISSESPF
ncbi:hypothetical protein [Nonomuraea sp. NPDC049750]|uniref:hypothetical protein n=1 Tax=Nonomuraea sp. NPDC049750 TaxID=3154738 RepID=UPI0033F729DD